MDYIILNLLIFLIPLITFTAGLLIGTDPARNIGVFDKLFPKRIAVEITLKCAVLKSISKYWTAAGAVGIIACAAIIIILHNSPLYIHIGAFAIIIFLLVFSVGFTYARILLKLNKGKTAKEETESSKSQILK